MQTARTIFSGACNEKLFREHLAYFNDIDYTETIDYLTGFAVPDEAVKRKLEEISLS